MSKNKENREHTAEVETVETVTEVVEERTVGAVATIRDFYNANKDTMSLKEIKEALIEQGLKKATVQTQLNKLTSGKKLTFDPTKMDLVDAATEGAVEIAFPNGSSIWVKPHPQAPKGVRLVKDLAGFNVVEQGTEGAIAIKFANMEIHVARV